MSSAIIQKKLKGALPEVNNLMNQISVNTDTMMEAMSDIFWTINSKNDRFDNVIKRMRAFAIEILEPKDCLVHFNISKNLENLTLDIGQRKNLFLLFKEVINNAAKYSECSNVCVDILTDKGKLVLNIRDDGKGFSILESGSNKNGTLGGNGLASIRKRARDLNGEIKIDSEIGKGTVVAVTFLK